MIIYIVVIMLSTFFAYLADNISSKKVMKRSVMKRNRIYYYLFCGLAFVFPFLLSAFRAHSVGTDTNGTYYDIYNIIKSGNFGLIRDTGYAVLTKISIVLFNNYSGTLFLTSLIICGLAYICIFRDSKYPVMSTLLFFTTNVYFISMNMIRQCIATMIFIFAIPLIKNKKCVPYFILTGIAFTMHTSAILYFPMYFLLNKKLDKKISIGLIIVFVILGNFGADLLINVLLKTDYFKNYFAWYLSSDYNTGDFNVISFIIALCIYVFLLYINKKAKNNKNYNILFWCQTIVLCILSLSSHLPLMQRMSWLFSFPLFIYLPKMFDFVENKTLNFMLKICVNGGYLSYMVVTIFCFGYNGLVPYVSIFS